MLVREHLLLNFEIKDPESKRAADGQPIAVRRETDRQYRRIEHELADMLPLIGVVEECGLLCAEGEDRAIRG